MFAIFVYQLASFFLSSIDYLIIDEMMFAFLPFIGLKGQSNRRLISLEEVKQHKAGDCIWTVLKGRVYNIAPYMKFHPGGSHSFSSFWVILFEFQNHCSHLTSHNLFCIMVYFPNPYHVLGRFTGADMLMKAAGKDCTALFSILLLLFLHCDSLSCCLWTHFLLCKLVWYLKAWHTNSSHYDAFAAYDYIVNCPILWFLIVHLLIILDCSLTWL